MRPRHISARYMSNIFGERVRRELLLLAGLLTLAPVTQAAQERELVLELRTTSGTPIEGAAVAFFEESKPSCSTNLSGQCRRQTNLEHLKFSVTKQGYAPVLGKSAWANKAGVVSQTLLTTEEGALAAQQQATRAAARDESERPRLEAKLKEEQEDAEQRSALIRNGSNLLVCAAQGRLMRGESLSGFLFFTDRDKSSFEAEFARRRLKLDRSQVLQESLALGMTECSMAASLGSPEESNRSVGGWGVHVQHVYRSSGRYVYTQNGRVTSWQD